MHHNELIDNVNFNRPYHTICRWIREGTYGQKWNIYMYKVLHTTLLLNQYWYIETLEILFRFLYLKHNK